MPWNKTHITCIKIITVGGRYFLTTKVKERKKKVKKRKKEKEEEEEEEERFVERESVVDEGEGWRRGEREGISFMREIAMKLGIKFKYTNFKVSYIIYNNYYFFINKKIQIIKINYIRIKN